MPTQPKPTRADGFYRTLLDAFPSPVFVMGKDLQIVDFNASARKILKSEVRLIIDRQPGDALRCLHARETPAGCGHTPHCGNCMIRQSVQRSLNGRQVVRQRTRMRLGNGKATTESFFLITTVPFKHGGRRQALMIIEDISELTQLRHILPICAGCKKIRNDQDYWDEVETYFQKHLDVDFSHGLCPDCVRRLYPELSLKKE